MNEIIDFKSNKDPLRGMFDDTYIQGAEDEITFRIGQVLRDVNVFRAALKDYGAKKGYEIIRIKNNNLNITSKCSKERYPGDCIHLG